MFAFVACTLADIKTGKEAEACFNDWCPFDPCAENDMSHWCVGCDWPTVNRCLGHKVPGPY